MKKLNEIKTQISLGKILLSLIPDENQTTESKRQFVVGQLWALEWVLNEEN